jgi:hypothetical protein
MKLIKRTHLITIILIAIAFTVLRLSGGQFSFVSDDSNSTSTPDNDQLLIDEETEAAIAQEEASQIKEQLVKDVLSNIGQDKDKEKERVVGDSLADIERAMGLK